VLKVSFCGLNGVKIYPLFGASNFSLRTREVCLDNIPNTNKRNEPRLGIRNAEQLRHLFLEEQM